MIDTPTNPTAPLDAWFTQRGWTPFPFQYEVWAAYLRGESGLIHAATGAGKTYAAWLGPLAECLAERATPGNKPSAGSHRLRVLWITPLRALAADTAAALQAPLATLGMQWDVETRTGDTARALRARQRREQPEALITTPESLSLLLSYPDAAEQFAHLRAVIVDEWHELLGSRRGVQTELCLARLRQLRPGLRTWGLSATLANLDRALTALVGVAHQQPTRLVRGLVPKTVAIESLIPDEIERFPWAGHLGLKMLPQVIDTIEGSATALVFTNTRAQTEMWYQAILDARPDWAGEIALHHGSLDRARRDWVEQALRRGRVRCVVCTSSLDLGVDFSPVETAIQIGSPRGIARLVQRAGRSGHRPGAESRVVVAPTSALELIEIAAAREGVAEGVIEARQPLENALDVLVQHMVTLALGGGFRAPELLAEVRTTFAYRNLSDDDWAWALDFITRGGPALRAYPEYARVVETDGRYTVEDRVIARRHRASIGTIVSDASIRVQYLNGAQLGTVEESFVARLKPGDRFVFAGRILEFVRVRDMTAWVRRADGKDAVVPRWSGSRLAMSSELAAHVRAQLDEAAAGVFESQEMLAVAPILAIQRRWSHIPAQDELLVERLRTREGYHLFCYPFEGRLVHEGLAALFAYRVAQAQPTTFTIAVNDYGFELLSAGPIAAWPAADADQHDGDSAGEWFRSQFSPDALEHDMLASVNATEMARRQFREIARVAGLVYQSYPGEKNARQFQVSSALLWDVFSQYDPDNPLLRQAYREVLDRQLERKRLRRALERIAVARIVIKDIRRPTPLGFPLLVDRLRDTLSSEKLADRVRRMQLALERAAS